MSFTLLCLCLKSVFAEEQYFQLIKYTNGSHKEKGEFPKEPARGNRAKSWYSRRRAQEGTRQECQGTSRQHS